MNVEVGDWVQLIPRYHRHDVFLPFRGLPLRVEKVVSGFCLLSLNGEIVLNTGKETRFFDTEFLEPADPRNIVRSRK